MQKVAVLMSTYNGELFIREQIDSIISQEGVLVDLFIRDDGSKDRTLTIIQEYSKHYENIKAFAGENIGVGGSFMDLVFSVPKTYDYYAFADQDDVWMNNKMFEAVRKISMIETPILYASNQTLVDSQLNVIGLRFNEIPSVSYKQILCHNQLSGCTMVWNNRFHTILSDRGRQPSANLLKIRIHDVWVAMVAAVMGTIVFDEESYILYRQHENNVVGVRRTNLVQQWIHKFRNPSKRNGRSRLCKEIYDKFSDYIDDYDCCSDIECYGYYQSSILKKFKLMRDSSIRKYTGESLIGYELKILMNLF